VLHEPSPIERLFWQAHRRLALPELKGLVPEFRVKLGRVRYRIDFALPDLKFGVELDGREHHSAPAIFTSDRLRDRRLQWAGWRLMRFSGAQVNEDPRLCVRQAATVFNAWAMAALEDMNLAVEADRDKWDEAYFSVPWDVSEWDGDPFRSARIALLERLVYQLKQGQGRKEQK
jgi:very-short-patch-repair endonuclease